MPRLNPEVPVPNPNHPSRTRGDIVTLLPDLDGGTLIDRINRALSDAVINTIAVGGKVTGKVSLELTLKNVGQQGTQLEIVSIIKSAIPHAAGKTVQDHASTTSMYAGFGGALSLIPIKQVDLPGMDTRPNLRPTEQD